MGKVINLFYNINKFLASLLGKTIMKLTLTLGNYRVRSKKKFHLSIVLILEWKSKHVAHA